MTGIYQVSNYTPCQIGLVKGERGENGANGANGLNGKDGKDGKDGLRGLSGSDGKSLYQIALDNGFVGTFDDYQETLKGDDNYQLAVKAGFDGDYDAWVEFTTANIGDAAVNSILGGFITIDSFELGATITQRNQALRHTATGKLYRWAGDLPKIVPTGSTPANSGGVATNAWLEVSDTVLRQELSSDTNEGLGALMVTGANISTPTVASLLDIPTNKLKDNQVAYVVEYEAGSGVGGGEFKWDSSSIADTDNGIIFGDVNETGRWIRVTQGERDKSEWYEPKPITDGQRFLAESTNSSTTYNKDNQFYKKLLYKFKKPYDEMKVYYPSLSRSTQKCFIEWDRGIFWMTFFGADSSEPRMMIAAIDIASGDLLTITAIESVSTTFEIVKEGDSRHLYVYHLGGLRYIDVTTLPAIGVDSVAIPVEKLDKVYTYSCYYEDRWYSFETGAKEQVSASAVKVYRVEDGKLMYGFIPPQNIVGYDVTRTFASKHQSIRIIGGEIVYAVGAGIISDIKLSEGGIRTPANRHQYYQGVIRYSPQNNTQVSSLVDPLAYKHFFGLVDLVEVQDVTRLAGGGLATIVNDSEHVYVIEEFASSSDPKAVNFYDYQSVMPNVFNIPIDKIIQSASGFGRNNIGTNNLIDVYNLKELTTWRAIVDTMVDFGVSHAKLALHPSAVMDMWFDDFTAENVTGSRVIEITLRANSDVYIKYESYNSPLLPKNRRFMLKGHFYFDDTKTSGLKKGSYTLLERYDDATSTMQYATKTTDPAWEGLPGYTGD